MRKRFYDFLSSIDKGLYFPLFIFLTAPLVFFVYGFVIAYFFVFFISFFHVVLLKVYPYVYDSDYYRYRALRDEFFLKSRYMQPIFSLKVVLGSYIFLVSVYYFSFFALFEIEQIFLWLLPFCGVAAIIVFSTVTVNVVNIICRPRLPKFIYIYHPVFQRRYSPVIDVIIHKVLPVCAQLGKGVVGAYTSFALGYKGLNGVTTIDPVRNGACNLYHGFPSTHKWTEPSLSAWSWFKDSDLRAQLSDTEAVKYFQKNETVLLNSFYDAFLPFLKPRVSK